MNALESCITVIPAGSNGECARFTIDDTSNPFVFSGITVQNRKYTLSFWAKAEAQESMSAAGQTLTITTDWKKYSITYTADAANLLFSFLTTGVYYIYHAKLEEGTISTAWTQAPEDTGADIEAVNQELQMLSESFAQLQVTSDGISSTVSRTEEQINAATGELERVKTEWTEILQTNSAQIASINRQITEDGVTKVVNTTGTFDEFGFTVDNSESLAKTQITPDGMVVKRKVGGSDEDVLTATSEGVEATNLYAKTFLIVGGRSRFENYGSDRTGCFWLGES